MPVSQVPFAGISNPVNFRNKIINGNMQIDQRGGTINNAVSANTYSVDRFAVYGTEASKMSGQQSTTAPTGFLNSLLVTSLAATSPSSGQAYGFRQVIEGTNISDLSWGSASAKTITISFWVRSSITGTYALSLFNRDAPNRSYVATYTISSANTFEYKTITIAGDTSGTWLTTNGQGIQVWWDLGSGSSFNETAGSWVGSLKVRTSGSSNWIGTSGATFFITGVQLEAGEQASGFEFMPIDVNLARCFRYYTKFNTDGSGFTNICMGLQTSTTNGVATLQFPVRMRTEPTVSISSLQASNHNTYDKDLTLTNAYSGFLSTRLDFSWTGAAGTLHYPFSVQIANNTSGYIDLSAEL